MKNFFAILAIIFGLLGPQFLWGQELSPRHQRAAIKAAQRRARIAQRKSVRIYIQPRPQFYFYYQRFPAVGGYVYPGGYFNFNYGRMGWGGYFNYNTGRVGW